jgi:predicted ATPase
MNPELKQWLIALIPALVPTFAVLLAILQNNRSTDSLRCEIGTRFDAVNQGFDDMRDLWRAELHRAEEILDARLKHL